MSTLESLRQEIIKAFKLSGFTVRKDASSFLAEHLSSFTARERIQFIEKITNHLLKQCLTESVLELGVIEIALSECTSEGLEEFETVLNVINAFDFPKLVFDQEKKKFYRSNRKGSLYSEGKWKAQYLIDRYTMIWQRTVRNKLFAQDTIPGAEQEKRFTLKKIEVLLSSSSRLNECIVLGLITQLKEGTYYLEDPTGTIPLDMTKTQYHSGLFTENSFVLAEGFYEDRTLHVMGLVQPPSEERCESLPFFGNTNTFGGKSKTLLKNSETLLKIEKENEDGMLVFISDVFFDSLKVMDKIKQLFLGFNDFPPIAIVFMGEFLSMPYGAEHGIQLKAALNNLADLINQFKNLKENCKFIFVPGNGDPPSTNILPRQAIPDYITKEIHTKIGDSVIFTTNPCRIQYCTQEIVVFRQDLVMKMCRNCIKFPESGEISDHLSKTLLSQCTLSPLQLEIQPLYWQYVDALNLYPMPDLVVIGDRYVPYTNIYQNCQIVNTDSFVTSRFTFKVYIPSSRTVEDSQIPDE